MSQFTINPDTIVVFNPNGKITATYKGKYKYAAETHAELIPIMVKLASNNNIVCDVDDTSISTKPPQKIKLVVGSIDISLRPAEPKKMDETASQIVGLSDKVSYLAQCIDGVRGSYASLSTKVSQLESQVSFIGNLNSQIETLKAQVDTLTEASKSVPLEITPTNDDTTRGPNLLDLSVCKSVSGSLLWSSGAITFNRIKTVGECHFIIKGLQKTPQARIYYDSCNQSTIAMFDYSITTNRIENAREIIDIWLEQ